MPANTSIFKLAEKIISGRDITFKEIKEIYLHKKIPLADFLSASSRVREKFKENRVEICSIVNAKSGYCPEDCGFCAQSVYAKSKIKRYKLLNPREILAAAKSAKENKAACFGIVASGKSVDNQKEIEAICRAVRGVKKKFPSLKCSVSLGAIDRQFLPELKRAGVDRIHHNLETSEDFFHRVCTTHTYRERLRAVREAKAAGFGVCSGGIFGIGEDKIDRLKLAFALRELGADSVPLNFLHPIKGTPMENFQPMPPTEILKTIAVFRLILPRKDIRVCGGRAVNLRGLQGMIFLAGANGMMIGNYLTQPGREPAEDLEMVRDLGLEVAG